MMKKLFESIKRNRLVTDNNALLWLLALPMLGKLLMFGVGALLIFWVLNNLVSIAIGIMLIVIPICVLLVCVVWAKGRLAPKKEATKA
jgi:hypothetical protein